MSKPFRKRSIRVPENNKKRFTIFIKKGVYNEQIKIPANKPFITLIGESAENTRISFDINNARAGTTSAAYAFYVGGHDFQAENLTFENSFDFKANTGKSGSQAVAVLSRMPTGSFLKIVVFSVGRIRFMQKTGGSILKIATSREMLISSSDRRRRFLKIARFIQKPTATSPRRCVLRRMSRADSFLSIQN